MNARASGAGKPRQGNPESVIYEAGSLAIEHPDRFTGYLMRALHEAGRTAEALAV